MRISDLIGRALGPPRTDSRAAADPGAEALVSQYLRDDGRVAAETAILASEGRLRVELVHAILARMEQLGARVGGSGAQIDGFPEPLAKWHELSALVGLLCRRHAEFEQDDLVRVARVVDYARPSWYWCLPAVSRLPISRFVDAAEQLIERNGLTAGVRFALDRLRPIPGRHGLYTDEVRLQERIDLLLRGETKPILVPNEPWACRALEGIQSPPGPAQTAWRELLEHAESSDSTKPSGKWLGRARELVVAIGAEEFARRFVVWASLTREPKDAELNPKNAAVLKGLVWCCQVVDDPALSRAVAEVAEAAYRKIPGVGARSVKVGDACIQTLGAMPGQDAVAQLARLRLKIKYAQALAGIEKALESAARRAGMTTEDLEELVVPTYGLEDDGVLRIAMGEWTAQARVEGASLSSVTWVGPGGKEQASVPAAVKQEHAEVLKALKGTAAEIEKMLPAQRGRIERLLLSERSWPLVAWRQRYLDHPLLASMARRLIWHFREGDRITLGIWHAGRMVGSSGEPIAWLKDDSQVRLWHPIGFAPEEVLRWRMWLEEHGISQPFKQAHREIYILTDAELATGTYSNRFAGHILKQHQLNALCRERGWRYRLVGGFDSGEYGASLDLPRWRLRVEFWIEGAVNSEMTEMGIFVNVPTDQVRFYGRGNELLRLTEVPALVFTEVMRDVDLFVGVCSVGNDPNWQDRGEGGGYGTYWQEYSFGELSATAETRRQVLERLLPRLNVGAQCRLHGRFLEVCGQLHTYKIHLGSGNILMSPNDQYLCIVPGGGKEAREQVFLPFEGDRTLSIILSKAFMLADDTRIKDPTIVRQIRGI